MRNAAAISIPSFRRKPESRGLELTETAVRLESVDGQVCLLPVWRSCFNFAGGSPAAGDFLLLAQKKVTKEKGTLLSRPFGVPCVARAAGRLRNSRDASIYFDVVGG
jgi:hypothetical protein